MSACLTNSPGLLQVVVQSLNLHLVVQSLGLVVPCSLDDLVGFLRHQGQLHHGGGQLLHGDPRLLLHQEGATGGSVHVFLLVLEFLLGLVHLGGGLRHLLHDLLQGGLELLHLLAGVPNLYLILVTDPVALLDGPKISLVLLVQTVDVKLKFKFSK